jgi:hypothetical protein
MHTEPEAAGYQTPIELSETSVVTQLSTQAAISDTTLTMEDKPPDLTAYVPLTCSVASCGMEKALTLSNEPKTKMAPPNPAGEMSRMQQGPYL